MKFAMITSHNFIKAMSKLLLGGLVALFFSASAFAQLVANPDTINAIAGMGGSGNVLLNDTENGGPLLPPYTTIQPLSQVSNTHGGQVSVDSSGNLLVNGGLAAGNYSTTYELCDTNSNCVTGIVTIVVVAPPNPPTPVNDAFTTNRTGVTQNILSNDTDLVPGTVANLVSPGTLAGFVSISGSNITISTGAPAGIHNVTYQLCDTGPSNCLPTTATVTVTVNQPVSANDSATIVSGAGGSIAILSNDYIDTVGNTATTANSVASIVSTGGISGLVISGGMMVVPTTLIVAGPYSPTYQICYPSPYNALCSTPSTVSITVSASLPTPVAVADTASVPTTGGLVSVMGNDTVNALPASSSSVLPSIVSTGGITGLTVNSSGQLVVPAFAAGTYPATYKLCYISAPTNCSSTVNVSITIAATPTAPIVAKADALTMSVTTAATADTTLNVLSNDTLNGTAIIPNTSLVTVTLTPGSALTTATLGSNGVLTLPKGTYTTGVYTLSYQICQASLTSNCSSATITVTIQSAVVVTGVGGAKIPPTVPGSPSSTTVVRGSNGSPIVFFGGTTSPAGAANQAVYFSGVKIGFGYGFGNLVGSLQEVSINQPQDPPPFNAQVFYSGSGNMRARWEVIQPGDSDPTVLDLVQEEGLTPQEMVQRVRYTLIERVYSYLAPVGVQSIDGPNPKQLPRTRLGTYRILLRLEATGAGVKERSSWVIPMLTYRVLSGGKTSTDPNAANPRLTESINQANFAPSFFSSNNEANISKFTIESVNVSEPSAGKHFGLAEQIVMRWQRVPKLKVDRWQIEVRDSQRRLLTAAWVAGAEAAYALSPAIRFGLPAREELSWRVVGLTSSSNPVASSSWMFFTVD